jgi:membrane fusion protein (multidrug efflux system)
MKGSISSTRHRVAALLAAALLSATLLPGLTGCHKAAPPPPAAIDVTVTAVEHHDLPITQEWVANVNGFVDAQIRAQVSGLLIRQDYKEGSQVKRGDVLFEIDPRPAQAALAQAKAQLAQAEAQAGKTGQDVKRYGPLAKEQAISQQELDDAVQADLAAKAQVAAGQAAVDNATVNLEFTKITSPVDGVAGIVQVQVGDLVGPATGVLTTVSTLDPMKVYFPISEQSYLDFMKEYPDANGFPASVKLQLILSDGTVYPYPGTFFASDRQIDPSTGTLRIAALFPNPHSFLRPGQYGRVRGTVRIIKDAALVPERAITELQGGSQLAVVDAGGHAHLRTVKLGARLNGLVAVEDGLQPDDREVIVEGFQKIHEGSAVHTLPYHAAQ